MRREKENLFLFCLFVCFPLEVGFSEFRMSDYFFQKQEYHHTEMYLQEV